MFEGGSVLQHISAFFLTLNSSMYPFWEKTFSKKHHGYSVLLQRDSTLQVPMQQMAKFQNLSASPTLDLCLEKSQKLPRLDNSQLMCNVT